MFKCDLEFDQNHSKVDKNKIIHSKTEGGGRLWQNRGGGHFGRNAKSHFFQTSGHKSRVIFIKKIEKKKGHEDRVIFSFLAKNRAFFRKKWENQAALMTFFF